MIGFPRKEFRGKLAIAITANFVNNHTTPEAIVEEISGVAFLYKQDFFNSLYEELGIALENIVYYKDETHYFVMTTKKHSLLDRKVLRKVPMTTIERFRIYILRTLVMISNLISISGSKGSTGLARPEEHQQAGVAGVHP